jgi:phosphatidylglycerophosphate synthase/SAM-dependent methyltransferase
MADPPPLTDGERWSRELLAGLRAGGFRPTAWRDFLRRSFQRAHVARAGRAELARQVRRWGSIGTIAIFLLARTLRVRPGRYVAWWLLCWAMLDWHLGMVEGPRGERRARLSPADALTLGRLALVPFAATPAERARWVAIVAVGAASDGLDGHLARRSGLTRLGAQLDSSADALFFSAAAIGAARAGWTSRAVALASLARHVAGVGYVVWRWFARGGPPRPDPRTRWAAAPSAAGLLLSAAGARRTGGTLLVASSIAATTVQAVAVASHARRERSVVATWDRLAGRYALQEGLEASAIDAALRLAAPASDERLVDLATGTGLLLHRLAAWPERPREAIGVDRSQGMLAGVGALPVGWATLLADARATGLPDGWAHVVTCCYVLHLLDAHERSEVLAEARRLLAPNAAARLVVVTVWPDDRRFVGRRVRDALHVLASRRAGACGGLRPLDPTTDLADAGFRVTQRVLRPRGGYPSLIVAATVD